MNKEWWFINRCQRINYCGIYRYEAWEIRLYNIHWYSELYPLSMDISEYQSLLYSLITLGNMYGSEDITDNNNFNILKTRFQDLTLNIVSCPCYKHSYCSLVELNIINVLVCMFRWKSYHLAINSKTLKSLFLHSIRYQ